MNILLLPNQDQAFNPFRVSLNLSNLMIAKKNKHVV